MRKHPNHPGIRDGDFENGIIIHEYGHGVSNRLTGGPAVNCLTGNEQAGEGWSDYYAISMLLDPALDDPNESARGMGPYALFQPNRQRRRHPAAAVLAQHGDPAVHVRQHQDRRLARTGRSLALPHGLGHGWAAVLWDLDWDLIDKHGFNPNLYGAWNAGGNNRAIQYVTDGLKMQGCGPGLVVARGAIVAATEALRRRRHVHGLGRRSRAAGSASAPCRGPTGRDDNEEAFDTHPDCLRGLRRRDRRRADAQRGQPGGPTRPMTFTLGGQPGAATSSRATRRTRGRSTATR